MTARGRPIGRAVIVVLASAGLAAAADPPRRPSEPGLVGHPAPSWEGVASWAHLPDGLESLDVTDFAGDVVFLFGFQSWCPGCHAHGFPTLRQVREAFQDEPDVHFVAIQTVFEGFDVNTEPKGREALKGFGLKIPLGFDPGPQGGRSTVLRTYRTGGTPWTILIDRSGIVRFNDFRILPQDAIERIQGLLAEAPSAGG